MLNGYEELENFHDLDETELDYLGITEPAQRAKILTAVDLMQDNSTTCKEHSFGIQTSYSHYHDYTQFQMFFSIQNQTSYYPKKTRFKTCLLNEDSWTSEAWKIKILRNKCWKFKE